MAAYQLNIAFTITQLEAIYAAKQNVTIVKTVEGAESFSWLSFSPFEANGINWDESDFFVYGATSTENQGVVINSTITQAVQPGQNYTLEAAGTFSGPTAAPIGPDGFQVTNQYSSADYLTFGLMQSVTVNGANIANAPTNEQIVLLGQHAIFRPTTQLIIFMASDIPAGQIVDPTTENGAIGPATNISFNPPTTISLAYDSASGGFSQVSAG
ncbi:MAG: hypothetical protein V4577_24115 [Bacteroidota bacterium]